MYAVINHTGELYHGHCECTYKISITIFKCVILHTDDAFVKYDNSWYCCDDVHINEISEDSVVVSSIVIINNIINYFSILLDQQGICAFLSETLMLLLS